MRTFKLRKFELRRLLVPAGRGRGAGSGPSTSIVRPFKTIEGAGRVGKKRLSWDASPGPAVARYRVYWGLGNRVDYDSKFADVGNLTALVLPDDIPSFPHVTAEMEIGITAISERGNESDMRVISAFFDFSRPQAPLNAKLEDL
jgi:hypothetical protein